MPQEKAVQAERTRDLRGQVAEIDKSDEPEILFMEISPGRVPIRVYSTKNGEHIDVPAYMIGAAMELKNEDGTFRFVADAKNAPEYKPGTIKCFLHKDSPERPILELVGLGSSFCPAEHLGSEYSKRMHGLHRHKQEFAAYQEHRENEKEAKAVARQEEQLEATLAIARGGTPSSAAVADRPKATVGLVDPPAGQCDICGKTGFKNVGAHKRGAHNERA